MVLNTFARNVCPPIIWRQISGLKRRFGASIQESPDIVFSGDYASWEDADRASTGYSAPKILAKTREALLKVKRGEAAFERDSVVFEKIQYEFPLLAGLLRAATANSGCLSVLDFGGALGSTYFQNRSFLSIVNELRWSVVEQPLHVACGLTDFADEHLSFYPSIEACLRHETPNVLLLSSVLQYLPEPYRFLEGALSHGIEFVIVERTAFMRNGKDRLTVQQVPAWIYEASYPAWFLSEQRFLKSFHERYSMVASFPALDTCQPEGGAADYKGFIFELKR